MQAVTINAFGGTDRLELGERDTPEVFEDRILVRVQAPGTGPWDIKTRRGLFGDKTFPFTPGFETSGVVEQVGDEVTAVTPGDEVIAYHPAGGGYAEYVRYRAGRAVAKPEGLEHTEAAGLPVAATTAHQGLVSELDITEGDRLLVTAAAGGIGHLAVQLGVILGATVVGTASAPNHAFLLELGASAAIDYHWVNWTKEAAEAAGGAFDKVLDCVGGDTTAELYDAVRDEGRIASTVPADDDAEPPRGIRAGFYSAGPDTQRLAAVTSHVADGRIVPYLDSVFPLRRVAAAHKRLESGHARGKVVLSLG